MSVKFYILAAISTQNKRRCVKVKSLSNARMYCLLLVRLRLGYRVGVMRLKPRLSLVWWPCYCTNTRYGDKNTKQTIHVSASRTQTQSIVYEMFERSCNKKICKRQRVCQKQSTMIIFGVFHSKVLHHVNFLSLTFSFYRLETRW